MLDVMLKLCISTNSTESTGQCHFQSVLQVLFYQLYAVQLLLLKVVIVLFGGAEEKIFCVLATDLMNKVFHNLSCPTF